ncbi:zinc finger CCCH domain-containing protein 37-like isoform X2 [Phalaenopsis equestris]|uniref:zinc finger CCCH domain-containing protein 37-like isoform X2 n=1 Tax=Phalaenopsis equestris TaxID=78828 RepID=UPI0009E5FFE4|nr:zinc finger CCCH domain-containing protein 37-like isoform X2 [Phalaenopsis equestris]
MAKQIYYSTTFPGGTGTVYSLYGAEPYLPVAVGSSRYATDGTALTGVGERASYVYTTQNNGLMAPGTEIPSVGVYSAGNIGAGLTTLPSIAVDGLGVTTTVNAESKRSAEALYNQSILAHSTIGPSDALLSTYSLAKRPKLVSSSYLPMYPQRPGEKDCVHYMLTRTCKFGEACKFDHPVWVPEGGIPDWKEVPLIPTSESLPERPGEPDCPYFLKTQTCKYGSKCKFNHPREKLSASITVAESIEFPFNSELPERPSEAVCTGEAECPFYLKTGSCKYGATCRYSHPDRVFINPTHTANLNNAILTPAVASYPLGVVNPAATFLPTVDPRLAQVGVTVYPQRPGEIECDYYMRTGHCKFGERCRFHHPVDRSIPNATSAKQPQESVKLTLAGLPRREGSVACPFYMKTGICKYGVACRFDHPPPGEAVAMAQVTSGTAEASNGDRSGEEEEDEEDTGESSE